MKKKLDGVDILFCIIYFPLLVIYILLDITTWHVAISTDGLVIFIFCLCAYIYRCIRRKSLW